MLPWGVQWFCRHHHEVDWWAIIKLEEARRGQCEGMAACYTAHRQHHARHSHGRHTHRPTRVLLSIQVVCEPLRGLCSPTTRTGRPANPAVMESCFGCQCQHSSLNHHYRYFFFVSIYNIYNLIFWKDNVSTNYWIMFDKVFVVKNDKFLIFFYIDTSK